MKRCSTIILRCAVVFAGVVMLAICGVIAWIAFLKTGLIHITWNISGLLGHTQRPYPILLRCIKQ